MAMQALNYEEVNSICKQVLEEVIGQSGYQHTEAVKWNQRAVEKITENLVALNLSYKYCGMALSVPNLSVDKKSELGRAKVPLGPGRGLIDWIRLSNAKRLSKYPIMSSVDAVELGRHSSAEDCWVLLYEMVYDVTAYLAYHPGGVEELLRAAGTDATELFEENHQWVNHKSMLEACAIGPFTGRRSELRPPTQAPAPDEPKVESAANNKESATPPP